LIQLRESLLRVDGGQVEERMLVGDALDDLVGAMSSAPLMETK
jgi:hypothetical protein